MSEGDERVKRTADRQISHLDPDDDDQEAPTQGETWKPASAEVLASRKIIRVRRDPVVSGAGVGSAQSPMSPFAAAAGVGTGSAISAATSTPTPAPASSNPFASISFAAPSSAGTASRPTPPMAPPTTAASSSASTAQGSSPARSAGVASVPRIDTNSSVAPTSSPAHVGGSPNPSTTVPGKPPKYSPNNLSVQIPSPSALSGASQSSQFLMPSSSPATAGTAASTSSSSSGSNSTSTAGSGGSSSSGGHTPGKSPKLNPFSSVSPKTNPFMSIDSTGKAPHGFWEGAETTAAAAGEHTKQQHNIINKGAGKDSSHKAPHGEADRGCQKEVASVSAPAPTTTAPALPVAPPPPPPAAAAAVPAPPAVVVNPFLKATSGISLNIPGNPFGIGVGGLSFPTVGGGGGSSFLSSVAAAASGKSVFGPSEGGGILKALSSGAAPVAVFGSSSFSSSGGAESGTAASRGSSASIPSILSAGSSRGAISSVASVASIGSAGSEGDKDGGGDGDIPGGVGDDYNPEEDSTAAFVPVYTFAPGMAAAAQVTGEENEDCLLQVRAKLFRLVQVKLKAAGTADGAGAGDADEPTPPAVAEGESAAKSDSGASTSTSSEWVEVGVGPLRILREKDSGDSSASAAAAAARRNTRIVMRREDKKGGAGTKVILNLRLRAHCVLAKNGDKAFSISTLLPKVVEVKTSANSAGAEPAMITTTKTTDEVEMVSYLLRCKAPMETDTVMGFMRGAIDACK